MNILYKISIDRVNANYISGWCFHRFKPGRPVQLECYQDEQLRAEAEASLFREDLQNLGMHPTGKCGFEFVTEAEVDLDFTKPVLIRPKGKSAVLADLSRDDRIGSGKHIHSTIRRLILKKKKLPRTAVFMHIPKTAGTSFNTLAQSVYPKGTAISHIELLPQSKYSSLAEYYNYISGHLRLGSIQESFNSENIDLYTILREPYAQLESHLKWLIQTAANQENRYFEVTNPIIYNLGVKLGQVIFADKDSLTEFVGNLNSVEAAFVDNLQTRYFLDRQPERVALDNVETAMGNSSLFKLIGITEKYDSFVREFGELNEIAFSAHEKRMNISPSAPLFDLSSGEVRTILLPLVYADLKIYRSIAQP
ncbi:MAG: hypothetical protein HKP52_02610 [Desulfofustis sp.]|nr:hypothetical protein [Desulfofustis sp.]